VASFVIRCATKVDKRRDLRIAQARSPHAQATLQALQGQGANAQITREICRPPSAGTRWARLKAHDLPVQGPLWAALSTKNPAYRDTCYGDALPGPQ
jgi:hypothetical protein